MQSGKKQLVYYSMSLNERAYEKVVGQFLQSVESLRRYNSEIPIRTVVTGRALKAQDRARLKALSVTVVRTRPYADEIGDFLPSGWAKAMALFPLVHKWLNLQYVVDEDFDQLLYLDNDTYFLRDVAELLAESTSADVYAREEPYSKKSWLGRDLSYLDEKAYLALTRREKVRCVTPFNCGVVLLKRRAAVWLAENLDVFLEYLLRFSIWMCKNPNVSTHPYAVELDYVVAAREWGLHERPPRRKELPFLGRNRWIVEERALWLALGNTRFSVKCFERSQVAQGIEFAVLRSRRDRPHLVHYYGVNGPAFAEWRDRFEKKVFSNLSQKRRAGRVKIDE